MRSDKKKITPDMAAFMRELIKEVLTEMQLNELEDKEIRFWALHADIFSALRKFPHRYTELAKRLTGDRRAALDFFWNKYFKDGVPVMEDQSNVDFTRLEQILDDMFEDLDIDINFSRHFKERVIERGLTEEDIIELMSKIHDQYGDEVADLYRDENRVFTHLRRLVDIAAVNNGYGDDYLKDLVLKTAYKRNSPKEPEFRTNASAPKLKVSEGDSIHDPVRPGILKNQIKGKVTCTKAKALKAKQKDKSNNTAKAAQRFLNYHCK